MFEHKESGVKFQNRKQCVKVMGTARYKKALKNNEFDFGAIEGD